VLTDAGLEKLRDAAGAHIAGVDALLGQNMSEEQANQLADLLALVPGVDADAHTSCSPA